MMWTRRLVPVPTITASTRRAPLRSDRGSVACTRSPTRIALIADSSPSAISTGVEPVNELPEQRATALAALLTPEAAFAPFAAAPTMPAIPTASPRPWPILLPVLPRL
jgi:hypothetical protein